MIVAVAPTMEDGYITLMVKVWLQSQKHTQWLLILDNLDDLESWNYKEYMPGGPSGSIVVTSRRQDLELFENGSNIATIRVQELHSDEALQLLVNDLPISELLLKGALVPCVATMLTGRNLIHFQSKRRNELPDRYAKP